MDKFDQYIVRRSLVTFYEFPNGSKYSIMGTSKPYYLVFNDNLSTMTMIDQVQKMNYDDLVLFFSKQVGKQRVRRFI